MPKRPHFLLTRDFSGTITYRDIINAPFPPEDVPFGGFVDTRPHFGGQIPQKKQFSGHE